MRLKQYGYYRDKLLTFGEEVEVKPLREVAQYSKTKISAEYLNKNNYVGVDNLLQNRLGKTVSNHVPKIGKITEYNKNDILIGNIRPYLKKIYFAKENGGASGDVLVIHPTDKNIYPKFLFNILSTDDFFIFNMQKAKCGKMPRGNKTEILTYPIPLPSLEKQKEIADILEKFDQLTNDISQGLPREIELREKQYCYYRDLLLNFSEEE